MPQRLHYIDNLKAVLILLVILMHSAQLCVADFDNFALSRHLHAFLMPLFVCVSGFVSHDQLSRQGVLGRRFHQLIVPFIFWAAILAIIGGDIAIFPHIIAHPDSGLWFLWALFFIIVVADICRHISVRYHIHEIMAMAVVAVMLCTITMLLGSTLFAIDAIAWYFIFFVIGYAGRHYSLFDRIPIGVAWISTGLFFVMAHWWMRSQVPTFMPPDSSGLFKHAYKFATAIVAIFAFIPLARHYTNRQISIMRRLANATLGVYATHVVLAAAFITYGVAIPKTIANGGGNYSQILIWWAILTVASLMLVWLLSATRLTSRLFLGKKVN